jgi:hypothetical protein
MSTSKHIIEIEGGAIVIQSCDEELANIGIFYNGLSSYHHVSIPALVREWNLFKYSELQPVEYDRILQDNKTLVIETIEQLKLL